MKIKRNKIVKKRISHIPFRFVLAVGITALGIISVVALIAWLCKLVPYSYILVFLTEIVCVISLIASDDNPDYKIPWLLFLLVMPIAGCMLYFLFYSRKLKRKYIVRLSELKGYSFDKSLAGNAKELGKTDKLVSSHAEMLCKISGSCIFKDTEQTFFSSGEKTFESILTDLEKAKKFIFL